MMRERRRIYMYIKNKGEKRDLKRKNGLVMGKKWQQ